MINALFIITSAIATNFSVSVGETRSTFVPDSVNANENDLIIFSFFNHYHNVREAGSAANQTNCLTGGSGFAYPSTGLATIHSTAIFTVGKSSSYFFCEAHCTSDMVFTVNVGSGDLTSTATSTARATATPTRVSSAVGTTINYLMLCAALSFAL